MEYSVFDTHCDTLCMLLDNKKSIENNTYHVSIPNVRNYRCYTQVYACFIAPQYRSCAEERCMKLIDTFYNNKLNGILSIEGGECIRSLSDIRNYYRLGVRIAALTWNHTNHIAGGADEEDFSKGITEFGRLLVAEMDRIGMFVDVSHLNDKSFYDIMSISKKPVLATHSCSRKICTHRRNLTDDMFGLIKNSDGCVGINFYPPFLNESKTATIDDIVKHIEHFMSLGGEDSIGIGADFDGVDYLPEGIENCSDTYKVFDRLSQLNYTNEQIEKISHKNFERILTKDV